MRGQGRSVAAQRVQNNPTITRDERARGGNGLMVASSRMVRLLNFLFHFHK